MPLPTAPTQRPNNPQTRQADKKTNSALLALGLMFAFIGLGALLLPALVKVPEMNDLLAKTSVAGWAMLALGGTLIALHLWRRMTAQVKQ